MQCRFASGCRYYQKNGYTCNNDKEASDYCGSYRQFQKYFGMNRSNVIPIIKDFGKGPLAK